MFVMGLSAFVGFIFLVIGTLVWGVLRILGRRFRLRTVYGRTLFCFLCFLPVFVFILLPLAAAELLARAGTRPPDMALKIDPSTFGCNFETVRFPSSDLIDLGGWWLEGEPDKLTLLLTHGLFRDRKEVVERACKLNQLGYSALVFDMRGHGASQGATVSMGFWERQDVLGADAYALDRKPGPVAILGVSMGAVATLEAAPELGPEVAAVVADSPFLSLRETVDRHTWLFLGMPSFPFSDVFIWDFTRLGDFQAGELNVVDALHRSREIPILMIYGDADQRMPRETAESVYQAVPHTMKELVFFEGAGHGAAYRTDPVRYVELVDNFLERSSRGLQAASDGSVEGVEVQGNLQ